MDVNQFIKHIQFHSGLTYRQLAEVLSKETGKKYTRNSLYAKVRRKNLKFEEANTIAELTGAKIKLEFENI